MTSVSGPGGEEREVRAHEGELAALAAATASPDVGEGLLDVAREAAEVVSAVVASPSAGPPSEADGWGAFAPGGQLTVLGPDFLLAADLDGGAMTIMSGDARWSIVPVDEEGRPLPSAEDEAGLTSSLAQVGRRALAGAVSRLGVGGIAGLLDGPVRVTVSEGGASLGDWTFSAGEALDNRDYSAETEELERQIGDILVAGVENEQAAFEESQAGMAGVGAPSDAGLAAGPDAQGTQAEARGGGGGTATIAGGVAATIGTMAVREGLRRASRRSAQRRDEAAPAAAAPAAAAPSAAARQAAVMYWFAVEAAVWAQTSAGANVIELLPGSWYPAHREEGGWVETTSAGSTGWVPAWAVRRAPGAP